jgi:hypothetical protein
MLIDLQRAMLGACYGDAAEFARALPYLRPAAVPVDKALFIHTATVMASLAGVLAQAYPSVERAMGADTFAEAAKRHLRTHPPGPAMLSAYGAGFGADLAGQLPVLAAADWAAHCAYFAADADPVGAAALAAFAPDTLARLRLSLVPSSALVAGPLPVLGPWWEGRADIKGVAAPLPLAGPDAVALIWRGPDLLVAATLLPPDAGGCVQALSDGADLLTAAGHLRDAGALSPLLALLLGHGLIAAVTDGEQP